MFGCDQDITGRLKIADVKYQCCAQSFFGHNGTCTGTGTLTKVLESALLDRQTYKSYGSIYVLFNAKQLNRVIK